MQIEKIYAWGAVNIDEKCGMDVLRDMDRIGDTHIIIWI